MGAADFKSRPDRPMLPANEFAAAAAPGIRKRVYLLPGQLHVSAEPCRITTILGSCVSICLFDVTRLVGGMNHFLLPISQNPEPGSLRYADHATVALLEEMMAMGCRLENMAAKIFGGAALFQRAGQYRDSLGAKNVASAIQMLRNADVPIVARETGGRHGRKVIFDTEEGVAWARRI